jgi:GXWXG protein/Domain of unknown function (DUF4334)
MDNIATFEAITQQGQTTTELALELFDQLDAVDIEFMLGRWQGSGFPTNHPMDGLLEAFNWYGKEFVSADHVHPLLFTDGKQIFKVDPNPGLMKLGLSFPIPQNEAIKPIYIALNKMLKTEKSKARVRMMEYRSKVSATMIYDYLPINDVFRRVDEQRVFGLMDFKEMPQPFFFILTREPKTVISLNQQ